MFCKAYEADMYGSKFQWLIVGMFDEEWWLKDASCPQEHLITALDGTIIMEMIPLSSNSETTIGNIVSC